MKVLTSFLLGWGQEDRVYPSRLITDQLVQVTNYNQISLFSPQIPFFPLARDKGREENLWVSLRERLGRIFHFRRCKDTTYKIGLVRICPYLSVFMKKIYYS